MLDRASSRGLVMRHADDGDGRVTLVQLTPEGEQLARRFLARLEAQTEKLRAVWPAARQRSAVKLLSEISDELDGRAPTEATHTETRARPTG